MMSLDMLDFKRESFRNHTVMEPINKLMMKLERLLKNKQLELDK
jgi:hypothetical protein